MAAAPARHMRKGWLPTASRPISSWRTAASTGASIILFGESLGAAVAVQTAGQREVRALILEAPFTSAVDVAVKTYPYLPARWLMKDRFESVNHIKFIGAPVLVIHGETDQVVPFALGQEAL